MTILENLNIPSKQLSWKHEISQSSVVRILIGQKWHHYKLSILQNVTKDAPEQRLQF